ncbi:hypothetical protein AB0876_33540 [Mycobacterium sp. NPDC049093]
MSSQARLDVGTYVELAAGVTAPEGLEDCLCCVVAADGDLRDVRRVSQHTGLLEGIEVRFLHAELRSARPESVRRCAGLRLRGALSGWRRAVADDDEDVDSLAILVEAAEQLADLLSDADPADQAVPAVCGYVSDRDNAHVVEIDTTEATGRVRVVINDGTVYDGDPNTDEPPGQYYDGPAWGGARRWKMQSLITGDTGDMTYRARSQEDAIAQYLDTVASNTLVWEVTEEQRCDECGAATAAGVSAEHGPACSLHPSNVH